MPNKLILIKRIPVLFYAELSICILFSLLNISFHLDSSLVAFPLSFLFTFILSYLVVIQFFKNANIKVIPVIRKLIQYLPFVLIAAFVLLRTGSSEIPYFIDLISALLWVAALVLSFVILFYIDDKRFFQLNPECKKLRDDIDKKNISKAKKIFIETFEWIDAFLQAAFTVSLINIFILQLYEIPSESMVPEFLIRDRVVVFKTASGPVFPLSKVGIPRFRSYKRGDIIVFRNPHYSMSRDSEVRSYLAQLVYMLTFTGVNLNVDEQGNQKADPLVKRITGESGEQLMMMDGVLYARTKNNTTFLPVNIDNSWAEWNVSSLPANIKNSVATIPISSNEYTSMISCEESRNNLSYYESRDEVLSLVSRFEKAVDKLNIQNSTGLSSDVSKLFSASDMFEYNLFINNDSISRKLMTTATGKSWFRAFMTDWIQNIDSKFFDKELPAPVAKNEDSLIGGDLYTDANFRLNLMIKLTFGRLIVRNAELISSGVSSALISKDSQRIAILNEAEILNNYIQLLDLRNMPVFPKNDLNGNPQYIPVNNYFMMGDNRFNSLDMRHSYNSKLVRLTAVDDYSVTYYSNMEPQYVPASRILGTTVLRFWPFSRFAIPGHTGKTKK